MSAESLVPPADLVTFVGHGDYQRIGREFLDHFVRLGGLRPGERVLDVGCGSGRMAVPLTGYLGPGGSYEGFDVAEPAVEWCRREITPRHPNFRFRRADVYNSVYHPAGRTRPRCFRFPYPAGSFDFVFLTSVFTHMLPADVENYVAEASRVLRVGGRCFATFFLLNEEACALIRAGRGCLRLPYTHKVPGEQPPGRPAEYGDCFLESRGAPEHAVAYEERSVADLFARCGFGPRPPAYHGSWCGRQPSTDFQDVLVATKERGVSAGFRLRRGLRALPLREGLWRLRRLLRAA
jgi:SAM-dependent methyltransferase